ncbi:MAG: LacI family DNA-binding transcriptional regulator [Anaerolineales bacterium]
MTKRSHFITIREVAHQAGVSVATVSRFINNAPSILLNVSTGLKIPENVSVVEFDAPRFAELFAPDLMTVYSPIEDVEWVTGQKMLELLNGKTVICTTALPTELVFRQSCGCCG